MTDDAIGILEKAIKTKPKDTKARADLHKKANGQLKELQKYMSEAVTKFASNLDTTTRTLEEAVGVASSEARLFDREIVRHLKQAIKLSKNIERPKMDWIADFEKAAKTVASWDPKAEGVKELEQGVKSLEAGKKTIATNMAANEKQQRECNAFVDKAIDDLNDVKDEKLKSAVGPYLTKYSGFFKTPS
jgi:uncharacterized phage infection (PIP) family protein YhgE